MSCAHVQTAREQAIDPLIEECVNSLIAMEYATDIANLRRRAMALAENSAELQYIQAQLHPPTMLLRQGEQVDDTQYLEILSIELEKLRQKASVATTL